MLWMDLAGDYVYGDISTTAVATKLGRSTKINFGFKFEGARGGGAATNQGALKTCCM